MVFVCGGARIHTDAWQLLAWSFTCTFHESLPLTLSDRAKSCLCLQSPVSHCPSHVNCAGAHCAVPSRPDASWELGCVLRRGDLGTWLYVARSRARRQTPSVVEKRGRLPAMARNRGSKGRAQRSKLDVLEAPQSRQVGSRLAKTCWLQFAGFTHFLPNAAISRNRRLQTKCATHCLTKSAAYSPRLARLSHISSTYVTTRVRHLDTATTSQHLSLFLSTATITELRRERLM
jgi:hypothetical protein